MRVSLLSQLSLMVTTCAYWERRSVKLSKTDRREYLPDLRLTTGYKSATLGCGERENLDREK